MVAGLPALSAEFAKHRNREKRTSKNEAPAANIEQLLFSKFIPAYSEIFRISNFSAQHSIDMIPSKILRSNQYGY